MPRSAMLWSAEPVKWTRYVPASPGGMTIRSTFGPRISVTLALACPAPTTRSTAPSAVNRAMTASGSSVSTSRSRSPMVSRRRRSEPACTILRTPGVPSSWATRSSEIAWARLSNSRCGRDSSCSIPSRIRCSVLAEMPFRPRSRPASAAWRRSSSDSTPRPSWTMRTVLGPTPGMRSRSTRLAGISARSRSWSAMWPVVASSTILSPIAWPTPGIGRRSPAAYVEATSNGARAIASAARW